MFLDKDIQQFKEKGISLEKATAYLSAYQKGFAPTDLIAPLNTHNGLKCFSPEEKETLVNNFSSLVEGKYMLKFTPASGAASRMFKDLHQFLEAYKNAQEKPSDKEQFKAFFLFWDHIKEFAFYPDLSKALLKNGFDIEQLITDKDYITVVEYLLQAKGLNYAQLPKAMLKFHPYTPHEQHTAIEEHLYEAAAYCFEANSQSAHLHFTVSAEHLSTIKTLVNTLLPTYEQTLDLKFNISYSLQKASTDIFAVNPDNSLFRLQNGSLLFRPGGHGALIENLNDLEADIVFIKNIDNVVPKKHMADTITYKKLLAAYLIELQEKTHYHLHLLDSGNLSIKELEDICHFTEKTLHITLPSYLAQAEPIEKIDWLYNCLNRPMRVCGMVGNEGEPGGGPFIVEDNDGERSFQIVESSQIDMNLPEQAKIAQQATHFNPVDLVCALKDYKGNKFNLLDFVDKNTGFIATKSYQSVNIKTQELPGLWNGAMAHWISLFVEVPTSTFNPVKTINDLLREMHR